VSDRREDGRTAHHDEELAPGAQPGSLVDVSFLSLDGVGLPGAIGMMSAPGQARSLDVDLDELIAGILHIARGGGLVAIHCWAGRGRTGLVTACCLVALGLEARGAPPLSGRGST
jgi:hypothetical protein